MFTGRILTLPPTLSPKLCKTVTALMEVAVFLVYVTKIKFMHVTKALRFTAGVQNTAQPRVEAEVTCPHQIHQGRSGAVCLTSTRTSHYETEAEDCPVVTEPILVCF